MSGASEALGRKIAGAQDLSAVVRSMKALAASSITQYERSVEALQDYCRTVELGLSVCLRDFGPHPLAVDGPLASGGLRAVARGVILFGSDQGLVGRFNEVLMEQAAPALQGPPGRAPRLWVVGGRLRELAIDAGFAVSPTVLDLPASVEGIGALVTKLLIEVQAGGEENALTELQLFHNQPLGAALYQPVNQRVLPLDDRWARELRARPWPTRSSPEIIGATAVTLETLIREYLFVLLFRACAQSLASENASRLAAMQRAEENIAGLLIDMKRTFHRLRQTSIDAELFEVISGFEALTTGTP
jgi:F-type H+-transporting ATPase subunit gamma